jgi:uncharacterized protein (TIGR02217 family)
LTNFHDIRFPLDVALQASGGPVRRTDILDLASGAEARNARHRNSRRRYDAGVGIKSLADMDRLLHFFEARAGQLYSFRFRDPMDHKAEDQQLGIGDGVQTRFPLIKSYGDDQAHYKRRLRFVDIQTVSPDVAYTVENGEIVFEAPIPEGAEVHASFTFDTIVRFDTDRLDISLEGFGAGQVISLPLIEVLAIELEL